MDTDEALFERLVAGDLRAFDRLYDRYERPLFGFIRAQLGGDAAEAEDVLHETFLAVLREREKRAEVRSVRAWLYTAARHLCLNRARARKRAGHAIEAAAWLAPRSEPLAPAELALDVRQQAERLARAVARLPQSLGEVYRLRAAGMSLEEVAGVLDVPLGTVKSRMHEMVRRLRQEMSHDV
ncbi:MAG TPA: RNA polymerase sigma factor [Polyangiaceae bacterium]|nr:RNA polymerase sigma factor [Polyangiaceae bacterium]